MLKSQYDFMSKCDWVTLLLNIYVATTKPTETTTTDYTETPTYPSTTKSKRLIVIDASAPALPKTSLKYLTRLFV